MNCLKCPNYWKQTVNENECAKCNSIPFVDFYVKYTHKMPPLFILRKE